MKQATEYRTTCGRISLTIAPAKVVPYMPDTNSTMKNRTFQHLGPYQQGQIQTLLDQNIPKAQDRA